MRTSPPVLGVVLALTLAISGCTNECDKLHTRLQACGYGATMPPRARFVSQCRANKAQFKVMLGCVGKQDCKDFRECVEAADAKFSTEKQEPVAQVAKRLEKALKSSELEEALSICASKRKDFSKVMRTKCDQAQAAHVVFGLRTARYERAFEDLKDFCWQRRLVIGDLTRFHCKMVRLKLYEFLRQQALRVLDHGPYSDLVARCKGLRAAADAVSKAHGQRALALCDDLNVAEPAAKAFAVVNKALAKAQKATAEAKAKAESASKRKSAMKASEDAAAPVEDPVSLPYQCGAVVKMLEKHGSKFALKRRDELNRLCHVRFGGLILARDVAKKDCSFHGGKVLAALRKYKLSAPQLVVLAPKVTKLCAEKAAREARKDKRGK